VLGKRQPQYPRRLPPDLRRRTMVRAGAVVRVAVWVVAVEMEEAVAEAVTAEVAVEMVEKVEKVAGEEEVEEQEVAVTGQ